VTAPPSPPAWLERLLERALPEALADPVLGDLHEEFAARAAARPVRARVFYTFEAARLAARFAFRRRRLGAAPRRRKEKPMRLVLSDARHALRALAKRPGTSLLLVATLAVGIAANAVIFSSLDALLLRPLGFPNLPRLVRLFETSPTTPAYDRSNVAPGNFHDWREQGRDVLADLVALEFWDANLIGSEVPERVPGQRVSPRFFSALGVALPAGRGFLDEEGRAGEDRRLVLGHGLWQRSFGGDAGIVGRSVTVDGEPHVVVGIAPPGFAFPYGAEIWAPLVLPAPGAARRDQHYLSAVGRLASGRTVGDAAQALALVGRRLQEDHADTNASRGVAVLPLQESYEDIALRPLLALWQAAAGLVLLIACVNVANLLLARGAERRRELALRLAVGARRGQLLRQLLTEGLVLALLAVAASLPLSAWAAREMRRGMPAEIARFVPGWDAIGLDARSLAFSVAVGLAATLLFSLAPALRASRPGLTDALKEGGRGAAGAGRQRGRSALVVAQVAGALALVVAAGLALRGASTFVQGPQGYDPEHLLTLQVTLPEARYRDAAAQRGFARRAEERLVAIPGVTRVGLANVLPGRGYNSSRTLRVEGAPPVERGREAPEADYRSVSPGYFEALDLPILAGRGLLPTDDETSRPVAVVSRSLAERHWPGRDPLGRRFRAGDDQRWMTVVGVSGDVIHHWFSRRNHPTFYRPHAQDPRADLAIALRVAGGDPEALGPAARRAVAAVDPYQPVYDVRSMRRAIALSTIGLQYVAAIMAVFGGLALVLAVSGVYGVMSYRVSLRTQEIGVRVALGASSGAVLGLTMAQAARLTALGLVAGSAAGLALAHLLSSALMGTIAFDGTTFAVAVAALAASALLAAYLPARRALAVDPVSALRAE
jgi:putative ABC transport system permease protein